MPIAFGTASPITMFASGGANTKLDIQSGSGAADTRVRFLNSSGATKAEIDYDGGWMRADAFRPLNANWGDADYVDMVGSWISSSPLMEWYIECDGLAVARTLLFQLGVNSGILHGNFVTESTGGAPGNITAAGDLRSESDARIKENVITVDNALEKVLQLRGVYFNRIDDESKSRKVGVIAQEVQEILPEVVGVAKENDPDEILTVSYANMAGLFIESIKDLKAEIDILKAEIAELKK